MHQRSVAWSEAETRGKVKPLLEVSYCPQETTLLESSLSKTFPACAITRSQSRKFSDVVVLSETFLSQDRRVKESSQSEKTRAESIITDSVRNCTGKRVFTRAQLMKEQSTDLTLERCMASEI